MNPLIFLDVDGVLNGHASHPFTKYNTIDKDKAERFNHVIYMTNAQFVVSSAWRYLVHGGSMSLEGLRNLLYSHWILADRLVGITRKDISEAVTDRGRQITEWLAENPGYGPVIAIDDGGKDRETGEWTDLGIIAEGHTLVVTQGQYGLTDDDAREAIAWLKAEPIYRAAERLAERATR